ncbi:thiamine/molybdopterin biosynthesis protein MoeB [Thermogemmatispora aurantia]|uniref:Thiamine/molybdopterin biosynthesis protein MoeB n=1 Tax=Thermogemmatispora aurantia TaxID=2045279 RepID=A0A5J4K133_9CHLR|nr:ThiF family adenylyltransferase [Thermogemmatispora aurantia]GER81563.1 thiamine/molybdopterin biosynthesis protein MoeB [Thermogemmatispora aurantia]
MVAFERYSRQTLFGPIGRQGQERLLASSVAIIGCGALGTMLANHLCRAGIGQVTIVDRDYVELSNLQRQILFDEDDVQAHLPKAVAAARKLERINSEVRVEALVADLDAEEVESLVQRVDLVLDATDNFETRYLLNDACVKHRRPWIYSGVIAAHGVTMNILPGETACLRCVFPEMPPPGSTPTCDTAGVLNGIVSMISGIAATEALKILLQSPLISRALLAADLWENTFERLELPRQPDCPTCSLGRFDFLNASIQSRTTALCGRNAVQVRSSRRGTPVDLGALAQRLEALAPVQHNAYLLRFTIDGYEMTVFSDGRAIIKGTDNEQVARSLYARYIGM